jgi:hypothetical protein
MSRRYFWIRLYPKRFSRHHVVSLLYDALIRREGKTVAYAHLIAALRVRSIALSLLLDFLCQRSPVPVPVPVSTWQKVQVGNILLAAMIVEYNLHQHI